MSRWFRHYAGMMRDDKLVRIALRSKQPIERVLWVWGAILESAAEIDDGGRFDFDGEEAAYFLRAPVDDIQSVLDALSGSGHIAANTVVKWGARQFSSDRSKDRVAAHRERKRAENSQADNNQPSRNEPVTLQQLHGIAPETETEIDTEHKERTPHPPKGEPALELVEDDQPAKPDDVAELFKAWNEIAGVRNLRACRAIDVSRRRKAKARIAEHGLDELLECIGRAGLSSFLTGNNERGHRAGIEYILEPSKLIKLQEGLYDDRKREKPPPQSREPASVSLITDFSKRLRA